MNKKIIIGIIIAILVIVLGMILMIFTNNDKTQTNNSLPIAKENNEQQPITNSNRKKILVVYYSAQNHTKADAEKIADQLNADTFEIIPEEVYTQDDLDWTNDNSRVSKEHNNEELRNISLKASNVDHWEEYDTILIGYPIWWGIAAWPVDTFVKANNFDGKTVIPFCTSSSSGLVQSGELLKSKSNSGNWIQGQRFSSNPSEEAIKNWVESLAI